MPARMTLTATSVHEFSPRRIAEMFCDQSASEQAEFWSHIATISCSWPIARALYWEAMSEHMTSGGAEVLLEMCNVIAQRKNGVGCMADEIDRLRGLLDAAEGNLRAVERAVRSHTYVHHVEAPSRDGA